MANKDDKIISEVNKLIQQKLQEINKNKKTKWLITRGAESISVAWDKAIEYFADKAKDEIKDGLKKAISKKFKTGKKVIKAVDKIPNPIKYLEYIEDGTNAAVDIGTPFQNNLKIQTPIDGLSFDKLDDLHEFLEKLNRAREKDLDKLPKELLEQKKREYKEFDNLVTLEIERYQKLKAEWDKYNETRHISLSDGEYFLKMLDPKKAPIYDLIAYKENSASINFDYDNKRKLIKGESVNPFWADRNISNTLPEVTVSSQTPKKTSAPVIPIHDINNPIQLAPIQIEADNLAPKLQDILQAEADKAQTEMMQRLESASSKISSLLGIPQSKAGAADLEASQNLEMEKLKGLQALGMTELYEAKKLEITKKYNSLQIEAARKGDEEAKDKLPQLEAQQQKLAEQKKPIKSVKGMLDKALFNSVADGFKKMGDSAEEAESKTIGVFSAISTNAGKVADFAKGFKSIFGGMDEGLDMVIDSVTNVAQGFATGGPVGGAIALLSEGMKLFNAASEAEKRHQEALKKIHEVTLAQEHAYQLAIRLKKLNYEDGNTIFGSDPYGKAINAAKVYKDSIDDLNKSLKGDGIVNTFKGPFSATLNKLYGKRSDTAALENIQIVTGHKKTGLFGMGKGKDTYSGVLSVYKDLIDSQGKLNIERAKSIIANEKMSDSDKAAFQRMIDNAEAIEQAYGEMKNYLTGIFGQLGNDMTNALVDSFKKGEDAADAFYKSASKMTQQLVKDVINSAIIAPIMQKAQEDAMKIMQDASLTDEQRMDKLIAITDSVVEQGLAASNRAKELYDSADQSFENKTGKNFETTDAEKFTQSSSKSSFETMSQDQAGELNGRFTALQMSGAAVEEYSNIIAANTGELLNETIKVSMMVEDYLNSFNELRSIQLGSFYELKDINKNTKELYAIREGIEGIKQNTSRL